MTIDAMGCQKEIAAPTYAQRKKVRQQKGHCLLQVKGNYSNLQFVVDTNWLFFTGMRDHHGHVKS